MNKAEFEEQGKRQEREIGIGREYHRICQENDSLRAENSGLHSQLRKVVGELDRANKEIKVLKLHTKYSSAHQEIQQTLQY